MVFFFQVINQLLHFVSCSNIIYFQNRFLPGSGVINIADISCSSSSTSFLDCDVTRFPTDCDHDEDMVLDCANQGNDCISFLQLIQ